MGEELRSRHARADRGRQPLAGAGDTRPNRPDRDAEGGRSLGIGQLAPDDEQQRVALGRRQPTQLTHEFGRGPRHRIRIEMCLSGLKTMQDGESTAFGAPMVSHEMVGDAQQPRESRPVVGPERRAAPKRPREDLGRQVLGQLVPDPPCQKDRDRRQVALIEQREVSGTLDGIGQHRGIRLSGLHVIYIVTTAPKSSRTLSISPSRATTVSRTNADCDGAEAAGQARLRTVIGAALWCGSRR